MSLMTEAATNTEGTPSPAGGEDPNNPAATAAAGGDQNPGEQQQPGEGDPAATSTATGEGDGKAEGAPEKYEFTQPEGQELNESVLGAFSEVAKELNLTQEAAQNILSKVAPVIAAQQSEAVTAVRTQWVESSRSDKEFGGEKLNENLAVAKKAMAQFGTPELAALLEQTGLGDNPEVIRAFYRAGKAISEDTFVAGQIQQTGKDAAKTMFPNQN